MIILVEKFKKKYIEKSFLHELEYNFNCLSKTFLLERIKSRACPLQSKGPQYIDCAKVA